MAGTKEGGQKAAAKNKEKCDANAAAVSPEREKTQRPTGHFDQIITV